MRSNQSPAPIVEPEQLVGGKYRIGRHLGTGAMGSVFAAKHEHLNSPAALKFLLPHLARVPVLTQRFLREGRVSASLNSPHVLRVSDVDQLPSGIPYLVMELLEGQSLQEYLDEVRLLSTEEAIDIAAQILSGLIVAHSKGVIHRDLKPDNVFLAAPSEGSRVRLLDFGIAKVRSDSEFQALTKPGTVMGTPQYMAPEQALSSDTATPQSDLYAVGVLLYEMISGELPADGSNPLEIAQKIRTGQVVPLHKQCPGVSLRLGQLVARAMSSEPADRPKSADAMRTALLACLETSAPKSATPPIEPTAEMQQFAPKRPATTVDLPPSARPGLTPKGRIWRWLAMGLVLLGFAGALTVAYQRWSLNRADLPPPMPVPKHLQK